MAVEAYAQVSFGNEIELNGRIGPATFTAKSRESFRSIIIEGAIGGLTSHLKVGRLSVRNRPVTGEVMGQQVKGQLTNRRGTVTFDGVAGEEPLRYQLDAEGACTSHDRDLGIRIVAQPLYSELKGTVGRIPDGAMIALLLPVRLTKVDDEYGS